MSELFNTQLGTELDGRFQGSESNLDYSQSGKLVLDIRKRKGIKEFIPAISEYEDKL